MPRFRLKAKVPFQFQMAEMSKLSGGRTLWSILTTFEN
jgi:hypothetical protein